MISGGLHFPATCNLLGKTCCFGTWTRQKSDPTRIRPDPVRSKPVRSDLNRFGGAFGSVFGSFFVRLGPCSVRLGSAWSGSVRLKPIRFDTVRFDSIRFGSDRQQWNCYLIRATGGMSIYR